MKINVLEYFEKATLVQFGDKTAIIDSGISYTFKELELFSKKCAALIYNKREIFSQPIAVFLPKSANVVIANLGITYSGNIYTNLDTQSPPDRIKNILDHLNPWLIITEKKYFDSIVSLGIKPDEILLIEDIHCNDLVYDNVKILSRLNSIIDTDPLCIINTSGSTGTPKGVTLSHRGVIDFMEWAIDRLNLDDSLILGNLSPFYFDIYIMELFLCLAQGSTMVIIPKNLAMFPEKIVTYIKENSISFLFWVPTIMVNIANLDLLSKIDLNGLKKILFAGETFPMKQLNYWRRHIPNATFINLYGPIEITVDCTYYILDKSFEDHDPLPIGSPCRNSDVLILNEKNQLVKGDELGELCVRGSSLALGYWNDPEKTSKAFVQNPLNQSYPELIYRTGDLVYRNEQNELMFKGRKDYQIKHLGYRIELGEIEHLVVSMEKVKNACVLYNKAKKVITLFYEAEGLVSPEMIHKHLSTIFPKYMIPRAFHHLDEMPRNPNGKIDRNGLSVKYFPLET